VYLSLVRPGEECLRVEEYRRLHQRFHISGLNFGSLFWFVQVVEDCVFVANHLFLFSMLEVTME
jgi:hypothetical protein